MKTRMLALLGGAMPLIAAGSARADFLGLVVESKPNEFGLIVCNVYAEFDSPGEDFLFGIGSGPPLVTNVQVIGGTFYQHPAGGDTAPNPALFEFFPSLRYDTFVTFGVKSFNRQDPGVPEGQLMDGTLLSPNWPGFQSDQLLLTDAGYGVFTGIPQSDPFDPNFVAGDGRLLVGQFATADGIGFTGQLVVNYNPGLVQEEASFEHIAPQGCLAIESEQIECNPNGTTFTYTVQATEPCSGSSSTYSFTGSTGAAGEEMCFTVLINDDVGAPCCTSQMCVTIPDCSAPAQPGDLDGDGTVGALDLLTLLAAWGSCLSCDECAADLDGDCAVGVVDMLFLLEQWGSS